MTFIITTPAAGHRTIDHRNRAVEADATIVASVIARVISVVLEPTVVDRSTSGVKPHTKARRIAKAAPIGRAAGDEAALYTSSRHVNVSAIGNPLLAASAPILDYAVGDETGRHPNMATAA